MYNKYINVSFAFFSVHAFSKNILSDTKDIKFLGFSLPSITMFVSFYFILSISAYSEVFVFVGIKLYWG